MEEIVEKMADSTASLASSTDGKSKRTNLTSAGATRVSSATGTRKVTSAGSSARPLRNSAARDQRVIVEVPQPSTSSVKSKADETLKNKSATGVAFDNRFIISGAMDGVLRIWDCLFEDK